jgi:hypothetical protein
MPLMPHEQKRVRQYSTLKLKLSPDAKTEVTKKSIAEFSKDILSTIQRKCHIKHWLVVLIESDEDKS